MVDSVNSSTSKLLEQIKRLSAQTNNNKISKKSDVSAFVIEGVKTGEVRKSVQTPEVAQIPTMERKRYKEPLGNLLDAYL